MMRNMYMVSGMAALGAMIEVVDTTSEFEGWKFLFLLLVSVLFYQMGLRAEQQMRGDR